MTKILTTAEYLAADAAREPDDPITADQAKTIASWWHGGRDHQITAISHGLPFLLEGAVTEIDGLLGRVKLPDVERAYLQSLRQYLVDGAVSSCTWSDYGHNLIGVGDDDEFSCLTCGAVLPVYRDDLDNLSHYSLSYDEDEPPTECTGDTSMVHGEGYCEDCEGEGCSHCRHTCNCLICRG